LLSWSLDRARGSVSDFHARARNLVFTVQKRLAKWVARSRSRLGKKKTLRGGQCYRSRMTLRRVIHGTYFVRFAVRLMQRFFSFNAPANTANAGTERLVSYNEGANHGFAATNQIPLGFSYPSAQCVISFHVME